MVLLAGFDREELLRRACEWWESQGYARNTVVTHASWIRRFGADCDARGMDEIGRLTRRETMAFASSYVRSHGLCSESVRIVPFRLHQWARALARFGVQVPAWRPSPREPPGILGQYNEFLARVRASNASRRIGFYYASSFVAQLSRRKRAIRQTTLDDVDEFLGEYGGHVGTATLATACSHIRQFLRFLYATGRLTRNLAPLVAGPTRDIKPVEALPWSDVRRVLAVIDRSTVSGKRDYALLLTMVGYGFGAAEAVALTLDDLDWRGERLRVVRPKTKEEIVLPLVGPVARAISIYLRDGRPKKSASRAVFLHVRAAPFVGLSTIQVRRILQQHARRAGVTAPKLGSHVLRHSHATRQVNLAAPPRVLSDILGHRSVRSLTTYARVAHARLRDVCLPVPR